MIVPRRNAPGVLSAAYTQDDTFSHMKERAVRDQIQLWANLASAAKNPQGASEFFQAMIETCNLFWCPPRFSAAEQKPRPLKPLPGPGIEIALRAAAEHGNAQFFERAASTHGGKLPYTFFAWFRTWLGESLEDENSEWDAIARQYHRTHSRTGPAQSGGSPPSESSETATSDTLGESISQHSRFLKFYGG